MKTRKGIFYFASYELARDYARTNGHPTDRIIPYEVGWAIQLPGPDGALGGWRHASGPYVGPCDTD